MARKRKQKVETIVIDVEFTDSEIKPKCFGCKEEYCDPELCGEWFEQCFKKEQEND